MKNNICRVQIQVSDPYKTCPRVFDFRTQRIGHFDMCPCRILLKESEHHSAYVDDNVVCYVGINGYRQIY